MKKTSIHWMLVIVFATMLFGSCKKDDDKNDNTAINATNLAGTYKLTKADAKTPLGAYDIAAAREACQKDDTYTLKADFTGTYNDDGVECDEPGDEKITWSLTEKTISIEGSYSGTIKSWDGKTLTIEGETVYMGTTVALTAVFVKQ